MHTLNPEIFISNNPHGVGVAGSYIMPQVQVQGIKGGLFQGGIPERRGLLFVPVVAYKYAVVGAHPTQFGRMGIVVRVFQVYMGGPQGLGSPHAPVHLHIRIVLPKRPGLKGVNGNPCIRVHFPQFFEGRHGGLAPPFGHLSIIGSCLGL